MTETTARGLASRVAERLPEPWFAGAVATAYRRFEPELRRLPEFCPPHGTALDVGAWYGPWSRALAARVDRVVAFEPNPRVAGVLRRTLPGNVRVVEAAAGAVDGGAATLWVPPRGMGTEGVASTLDHAEDAVPVTVTTTTLDAQAYGPDPVPGRVTLVKVDVEGAEQQVIDGAARLLDEHRPVLVVELEHHRSDVDATVRSLVGRGYRPEVLVEGRWRSLDDFDLPSHQAEVLPRLADRGLLGRVLRPGPAYVNNVVFRPVGR